MKQVLVGTLSVWHINGIILSIYIYIYPEFPVAKSNGKILGTQKKNILIPLKKSMTYDITICVDVSAYFSTARWAVAISDL